MVVHQDHGGGGEFERALDHLARIDRGVIDGAGLMLLVGDQVVTLVEEQNAEVLLALEGHGGPTIVEHVRPRRQHLALFDLAAHEAIGCRLHDLEFGDGGLSQTVDLVESFRRRRDHFREGAERGEQVLRERLHVALRDGAEQDQLEHFVIADRLAAGREKSLPQAPRARMPASSDFAMAARRYARGAAEGRGRSSPRGDSVKISTPPSVTATVCSNWAESERSRVTAVQPSESTFTCGRPRLIIGSTVKNMPGRSTMPSPGRPTCTMLGSSWNRRPTPWPQKSRTTLMCWAST